MCLDIHDEKNFSALILAYFATNFHTKGILVIKSAQIFSRVGIFAHFTNQTSYIHTCMNTKFDIRFSPI